MGFTAKAQVYNAAIQETVLGVGDKTETKRGLIDLIRVLEEGHSPGGAAEENGQHAGGHGVQRPSVADMFFMKDSPQLGGDVL